MRRKPSPPPAFLSGLVAALALALSCCGQNEVMRDQISVRTHDLPVLEVPAGSVPVTAREPASSLAEAAALSPPGGRGGAAGEVAYRRFCGHCHGRLGRGWTSIGSSLDPAPRDLVEAAARLSDGEMFGVATFGSRRSPALGHAIPVDDRWALVRHVRTLEQRRRAVEPAWGQ